MTQKAMSEAWLEQKCIEKRTGPMPHSIYALYHMYGTFGKNVKEPKILSKLSVILQLVY